MEEEKEEIIKVIEELNELDLEEFVIEEDEFDEIVIIIEPEDEEIIEIEEEISGSRRQQLKLLERRQPFVCGHQRKTESTLEGLASPSVNANCYKRM